MNLKDLINITIVLIFCILLLSEQGREFIIAFLGIAIGAIIVFVIPMVIIKNIINFLFSDVTEKINPNNQENL